MNFCEIMVKPSINQFFRKKCSRFPKMLYFCSRKSEATLAQLVEQRIRNA